MTALLSSWLAAAGTAAAGVPLDAVVSVAQGDAACAGAFVAEDRVVTAYHCIASGGRPLVTTRTGVSATARVVSASVREDVALLATPAMAPLTLEVREAAPDVAEPVWAVGHPYGGVGLGYLDGTLGWSVSQGIVAAVGTRAVQVTAPVAPGSSGGPVVDAEGRLVGVVSRRLRGDGLGFATRTRAVRDLMEDERGLPPFGGTLSLGVGSSFLAVVDGAVTADAVAQLAVRDRVVLGGTLGLPLVGRWDVLEFGSTRWLRSTGRLGLRQRIGRGPQTVRLDAFGGIASLARREPYGDFGVITSHRLAPLFGGSMAMHAIGVHALAVQEDGAWVLQAATTLSIPGIIARF